jgi:hypothetical protein
MCWSLEATVVMLLKWQFIECSLEAAQLVLAKPFFSSLLDSIIAVKLFFFFPFWTTFVL